MDALAAHADDTASFGILTNKIMFIMLENIWSMLGSHQKTFTNIFWLCSICCWLRSICCWLRSICCWLCSICTHSENKANSVQLSWNWDWAWQKSYEMHGSLESSHLSCIRHGEQLMTKYGMIMERLHN